MDDVGVAQDMGGDLLSVQPGSGAHLLDPGSLGETIQPYLDRLGTDVTSRAAWKKPDLAWLERFTDGLESGLADPGRSERPGFGTVGLDPDEAVLEINI